MCREPKPDNDLFFVCSVIEYIGRKTLNNRIDIVEIIGEKELTRILSVADVLHCEPIEKTVDTLIKDFNIQTGNFDNIKACKYSVPTAFDIAKVYKRLIVFVCKTENISPISALIKVCSSPICERINDFNCSMYYESPQYLEESYKAGKAI